MIKNPKIRKVLIILAACVAAFILFVPIISRSFLTHYALKLAEHYLQMEVKISSAELHLLSGSLRINDMAVYHPKREGETFIEADSVDVGFGIAPVFIGGKPWLKVEINSPKLVYVTDRRGEWELKNQVPLFRRGKGEKRFPINVERITINDGFVEFRDGKVGKTTKLSDIDLDVKKVQLPTEKDPLPAKFNLTFKIDKSAKFKMKGRADFLSPKISFDSDIKLSSLPLPPFAPYYDRKSMPVRITRGSVAMTSHARCKDDYLNAPAHMTISGLRVTPKKAAILGFASDRVVNNLKDKHGHLELDTIISGNIKSPRFHITSNLSQAFAKAFTKSLVADVKDMPFKVEDVGQGIGSKVKDLFGK
jgi:hypothetical protein